MSEAGHVPEYVLEALEEVRASGLTNMFDRQAVLILSGEYSESAEAWLYQNKARYMEALRLMGQRRVKP